MKNKKFDRAVSARHIPATGLDSLPNNLWLFMWFFFRQTKKPIIAALISFAIAAICYSIIPIGIKNIVDEFMKPTPNTSIIATYMFLITIGGYGGWYFFWSTGNFIISPNWHAHFREMVRSQLFQYISKNNIHFFENDYSGRLSTKINNVGFSISFVMEETIYSIWPSIVTLITITFIFLSMQATLAITFFIGVLAHIIFCIYYIPQSPKKAAYSAEMHSQFIGTLVDVLSNIKLVKLFIQHQKEEASLSEHAHKAAEGARDLYMFWFSFRAILGGLSITLIAAICAISFYGYTSNTLAASEIILAISTIPLMATNIWSITTLSGALAERLGIIQDGIDTLVVEERPTHDQNTKTLILNKGHIAFKNVEFSYNTNTPVLKKLSIDIPAGQKIGLIGKSGAGKSTLINLLLRFYETEKGTITIDGQNIGNVTQESVRQNISVVTQEPSLFHRSIRENIGYGKPNTSLEDIQKAAKRAHAHDFILNLKDKEGRTGYDAHVGERGVKLSGGQRQRIAIARVILANAPILILDEATSALDSEAEAAIQQEITSLMKGKTVIAIAHRLSTIKQMDRLIVLDEGEIVEDGSHQQLLRKKNLYAKLWKMQSGGFLDI